jgi:Ca2+-transporting ATPase
MGQEDARNLVLPLMVLFENVQAFNARSERRSAFRVPYGANPLLIIAVIGAQAIHIGAMYMPGLAGILDTKPIGVTTWLAVAAIALTLLGVAEIYKSPRPVADDAGPAISSSPTRSR